MNSEPLTEAVGDTQKSPLADPAPTEVGVKTPHTPLPQAWSEEECDQTPAGKRRVARWVAIRTVPVLVVAGAIIAYVATTHPPAPTVAVAHPPPTTTPPIQAPPPAPPAPKPSKEDRFMAALLANDAEIVQKDMAIHNAHGVCTLMEQGMPWQEVANVVQNQTIGYTEKRADTFVALSIGYYCPQYGGPGA